MDFLEQAKAAGVAITDIPSQQSPLYQDHTSRLREIRLTAKPRISSGLQGLDTITGRFNGGQLIILSGPTKNGKTTFAQTLSWNMAREGTPSLWLSYEMSWQELTTKFQLMDDLYQLSGEPTPVPIAYPTEYFQGKQDLNLSWVKSLIQKAIDDHGVKFVFIDHLHFLLPLKDMNNISFVIGGVVREIKKMAVSLDIPIMLIAHTGKLPDDKVPGLDDIRDSSFIVQESDYALMVYRERNSTGTKGGVRSTYERAAPGKIYSNRAVIRVLTNRYNGNTEDLVMWHDGTKFVPYNSQDVTPETLMQ